MTSPEPEVPLDEDLTTILVTVRRLRMAGIDPTALVVTATDPSPRLAAERIFGLPVVYAKVDKPGVIV